LLAAALLVGSTSAMALDPVQELMRAAIEQAQAAGGLHIAESTVAAVGPVAEFYSRREFRPLWTRPDDVTAMLGRVIPSAAEHGLDPNDFHLETLTDLERQLSGSGPIEPTAQVGFDLLMTDALVQLAFQLHFGRLNPGDLFPNWNFKREVENRDAVDLLGKVVDSGRLEELITMVAPQGPFYRRTQASLARYRQIAVEGGWPTVPTGPTLREGMEDKRVSLLRKRLQTTGDLAATNVADPDRFDESVEQAVIRFQTRHGIDADGAIGPQTLATLNVPAEMRVTQLRINLERLRWVFQDVEADDNFVTVNIAGFRVGLFRDSELTWTSRAQVGKPYRKSPVFKSVMKYIVFNPDWTVPPGILTKDVLPKIRQDIGYLERKNMRVVDLSGKTLDPHAIDWSKYSGRNFPYRIRQDPGPWNALGRIKFIFHNSHLVFLHDTPSRELFDRSGRAFSSGCIRVEHPVDLAELLLADVEGWDRDRIEATLDSKKTQTVFLAEPLTVMLLYVTAVGDEELGTRFMKDIYDRDRAVEAGLDRDFVFTPPDGAPATWAVTAQTP